MPRGDGTGPWGMGPMTGGTGPGYRRYNGTCPYVGQNPSFEEEMRLLRNRAAFLEEELRQIRQRLSILEGRG